MSRRTFYQGNLEIIAGWDRPLQHFFLDVYNHAKPMTNDEDESMLYSSLDEPSWVYETFSVRDISNTFNALKITPPPTFLADLQGDSQEHVEHLDVSYGPSMNPPEDPEYPCECCGEVVDQCTCPVCPVCYQKGLLGCYGRGTHPESYIRQTVLRLSVTQLEGMVRLAKDEIEAREEGRLEAEADEVS